MKLVNVYCRNKGWLFEDLKSEIAACSDLPEFRKSAKVVASENPLEQADAYICIRDTEARFSPDPKRTVVQLHHTGRVNLNDYGVVSMVHPSQKTLVFDSDNPTVKVHIRPIGARPPKREDYEFPEQPTLGGFFREVKEPDTGRFLKGSDLFAEAVEKARENLDFEVLLIGERLSHIAHLGTWEKRAAAPGDYGKITALMTTSVSPMVPLSAYEAIAAGKRVISTPREWPSEVYFPSSMTGVDAETLAKAIVLTLSPRTRLNPHRPYMREDWCRRQVLEALKLI